MTRPWHASCTPCKEVKEVKILLAVPRSPSRRSRWPEVTSGHQRRCFVLSFEGGEDAAADAHGIGLGARDGQNGCSRSVA